MKYLFLCVAIIVLFGVALTSILLRRRLEGAVAKYTLLRFNMGRRNLRPCAFVVLAVVVLPLMTVKLSHWELTLPQLTLELVELEKPRSATPHNALGDAKVLRLAHLAQVRSTQQDA
jgi:hypothetical protein